MRMLDNIVLARTSNSLQLDWTSCADTQKINLSRDQEGYNGFEYTDEKLSARHIQLCGAQKNSGHISSIL